MPRFTHPFLQKIESAQIDNFLISNENTYSYEMLLDSINTALEQLKQVSENSIIGVIGDYDMDSIAMLLGCIEMGNIVCPLPQSLLNSQNLLKSFIKEGQLDYLYINNTLQPQPKIQKHDIITTLQQSKQSGLILFSSGSTGKPKAIVHNLNTLLSSFLNKRQKRMNILLFLMFDHIGGLNTLFHVLAIGACGIALKNRKDMQEIAKSIQDYKISLLPASPSLLHLFLLANVKDSYDISSLKLITYGTEKMPDSLLAKLKKEFPKVKLHQSFGASEIGITQTTTSGNFIRLENMEYKIINNELFIKSSTNALGYLNSDNSVFDEHGYFATGDLVETSYINGCEYIKIVGRSKEVINVGGEKVMPQEVEGVILEMPCIEDCLVYGDSSVITGQSVSVKVVLTKNLESNPMEIKRQIRAFCRDKLSAFKIPSKVVIVESLEINDRFKRSRNDSQKIQQDM